MQFSVRERLILSNLIPPQMGHGFFLKTMRQFREALSFSEADHTKYNFIQSVHCSKCDSNAFVPVTKLVCPICSGAVQPQPDFRWNAGIDQFTEIEVNPTIVGIISEVFKQRNAVCQLDESWIDLALKFVPEDELFADPTVKEKDGPKTT